MAGSKIMVVDDDSNICELLRLYLEKEGFDPVIAGNGVRALEMFERRPRRASGTTRCTCTAEKA